jgi:nicotinamidase-related amidase
MTTRLSPAEPPPLPFDPARTALAPIDMQRDLLELGGFGAALGDDASPHAATVGPCARAGCRAGRGDAGGPHLRRPSPPSAKMARSAPAVRTGDPGAMDRILIRAEPGHALIDALAPMPEELALDKPGKGAFHKTGPERMLRNRGIDTLIIGGVTAEVRVHSIIHEANDRPVAAPRCTTPARRISLRFTARPAP